MSLIDKIVGAPWAITPETLESIIAIARRENAVAKENWPTYSAAARKVTEGYRRTMIDGDVAVISVTGPIFPKANMMTDLSGATSLQDVAGDFRRAMEDGDVSAVVLDIDSPGGVVHGIATFADAVAKAGKPVVAYTDAWMASAAYFIGAAADEIYVDRSASVGSIGVVGAVSKQVAPDRFGEVTVEIVSSNAPLKRIDPANAQHVEAFRAELDDHEAMFIDAVAKGRGVTVEKVKADFGQGGMLIAKRAKSAGMVDQVGSLKQAINRARKLAKADQPAAPSRATVAGDIDHGPEPEKDETMSNDAEKGGTAADVKTEEAKVDAPKAEAPKAKSEDDIRAEAAKAERDRIKSIRDAALPGQDALVDEHIEAGSTPEQFAMAALAHEKSKGAAYIEERRKGEEALGKVAPKAAVDPAPKHPAGAISMTDDEAKARFAADAAVRDEFVTVEAYVAFCKAEREGKVKYIRKAA